MASTNRSSKTWGCLVAVVTVVGAVGCGDADTVQLESGMLVKFGLRNRPESEAVARWADDVVAFWGQKYQSADVARSIDGHLVEFVDQERIDLDVGPVRGFTVVGYSMIGMRELQQGAVDFGYVESLFKHELAHAALAGAGVAWDEALHHSLMNELGYGY